MLCDQILHFLFSLRFNVQLPRGVQVMDVHNDPQVQLACTAFYQKYYQDNRKRYLIIGINPGRLGGGITGIPFTDPVNLERACGITNPWKQQHELSSRFIYDMIAAYGGPQQFYSRFYISAISPLGFVQHGKNLNYYDHPLLAKRILPFVVDCLQQQLRFGLHRQVCFCIGEGENFRYLQQLNQECRFFSSIVALPHPRFIMQYRQKQKEMFIERYITALSAATP